MWESVVEPTRSGWSHHGGEFGLSRGICSFNHKINFLLGHTMMREARVLNFEGRNISGSRVVRSIFPALRSRSREVKKDNCGRFTLDLRY
jgi:hypothetical protein